MAIVDLHMHTTYSDGGLTPTQMVNLVASRGVKVFSITDHDSTEGLTEAMKAMEDHPELTLIPGCELSADIPGTEVHILTYYIDWHNAELQDTLSEFRDGRFHRGKMMVKKLNELGKKISWERVLELADGAAVGRPHVAKALVEAGHVSNIQDAFDQYLSRNGPAYSERDKLTPEGAVKLALEAGGLAVLAHPTYVKNVDALLPSLVEAGLAGIEVYYGGYDQAQVAELESIAERYGLIPCGGSDYHAMGKDNEAFPGDAGPPLSSIDRLHQLLASSKTKGTAPN